MKKIIVYFPYPLQLGKSGSAVRPRKILEAFEEYALEHRLDVISIYGESKNRKEKLNKLYKETNKEDILFCYMENSTLPFWLTDSDHIPRKPLMERKFMNFLKKNDIPLGLFYRDVYWKFDNEYPLKGIKRTIMRMIYKRELFLYKKYVEHFFLPSIEMNKHIDFPDTNTSSLPPGGNIIEVESVNPKNEKLSLIYVGGISERYGSLEMLEAVDRAYQNGIDLELHLVCRPEEYQQYETVFKEYVCYSWLNVYHAYGEQLKEIYSKANIGIIPIQKTIYNDFAVPVKMFEYLSFGLPILSTNCAAQSRIIKEDNLGIVVEDNVDALVRGIEYLADNENRNNFSENVKRTLIQKHLWIHRIESIVNKLTKRD